MYHNQHYLELKEHAQYLQEIKDKNLFKTEFKRLYLYHINITKKFVSYISKNGIRIAEYTKESVRNEFKNILVNHKTQLNTTINNNH